MRRRSKKGSLVLELSVACFFMLVFALLSVHSAVAVFGAYINDRACRDACRAAAQASTLDEAHTLVYAVLKNHASGSFLTAPKIVGNIEYQDYGGKPSPNVSPYVKLSTSLDANLPFQPLAFFGQDFKDGKIVFTKSYAFPIVRLR